MAKQKLKPQILRTREAMEAEVNLYTQHKLRHVALTAEMEREKAAVEKRYQERIHGAARDIELSFAAVQNYCLTHRPELLTGDNKSFETVSAVVKFYNTPPRVEKRGKETFGQIAKRLLGLVFTQTGTEEVLLDCAQFVRDPEPELDKEALLSARASITEAQAQAMGIKFEQEEVFAIVPKSQLAEADTATLKEAA